MVPLLIDMHAKSDEPDAALAASLARRKEREGGADLLYVGKISPHKAPHDLVKMLDVLRRVDDPAARLHLVGSPLGETYEPALRAFIEELGLTVGRQPSGLGHGRGARGVLPGGRRLRDGVGPRGLLRPAGRGHGPRRPRSSPTASPRSPRPSARAGLVLPDKSPVPFATAVGRVLEDATLRKVMVEAGTERAAGFDLAASTRRFVSLVQAAVGAS